MFLAQILLAQNVAQPKVLNFISFGNLSGPVVSNELDQKTPEPFKSHPEYGINPHNTQCTDCIELIDKRTDSTRYFIKNGSNGSAFSVQKGYAPLHFKNNNNQLITIDPRLKPHPYTPNLYHAPNQQMPTSINKVTGHTSIQLSSFNLVFNKNNKAFHLENNTETQVFGSPNLANTTVGEDGAKTSNFWNGIDKTVAFDRGSAKTNYILNSAPSLPNNNGWLAFEDEITLPAAYKLVKDTLAGTTTPEGYWNGELKIVLVSNGSEVARIANPLVYDNNEQKAPASQVAYRIKQTGNTYYLQSLVSAAWLSNINTVYPVTYDPLIAGSNTWTAGNIGFTNYSPGNGFCGNSSAFCLGGTLNVTFPGGGQITNVLWSMIYIATAGNPMQSAGFRMVGPCGENPTNTNSWWSCNVIASGTCNTTNLSVPNLATCYLPSCSPTVVPFQVKNINCAQNDGVCGTTRYYTLNNSWIVTVQGLTVEQPPTPLSSSGNTICSGMCTVLTATGNYGVPAYSYVWNPGNITGNGITVCPPANTTTNYTCTITDQCGNTATNVVAVTAQSVTLPLPTISTQMNPIAGTPCPVTVTICGDVGNNYGGGPENFLWAFPGGVQTGGGALSGSSNGPIYGGAGSATFCANGASYTVVYNATGTYTISFNLVKSADCTAGSVAINISCVILPIELSSFYLKYNGNICDINWTTSTEKNSDHFLVEKSVNGGPYVFVGQVPAAGNSTENRKYLLQDSSPEKNGNTIYRLRMFEKGSKDFKNEAFEELNTKDSKLDQINVQPNPAGSEIVLLLTDLLSNRFIALDVYNSSGQKVISQNVAISSKETPIKLAINGLAKGLYTLYVFDESGNVGKVKFVKE